MLVVSVRGGQGFLASIDAIGAYDPEPDAHEIMSQGNMLPIAQSVAAVDDDIREALDEADFFVTQGLFDDALSLLQDLIPRFPGHPLLIRRMQLAREAKRACRH